MKILQTSIVPVISMLSLALLSTAHARKEPEILAVQQFTQSNNVVTNFNTIGSLTSRTSFGLFFSGMDRGISDNNIITNFGTIISGTGNFGDEVGNAGIIFAAINDGQSNLNIVTNFGTIIGVAGAGKNSPSSGIYFLSSNDGDTNENLVQNQGLIIASGTGPATGINFTALNTKSANDNTIINDATITAVSELKSAVGIGFDSRGDGDTSGNWIFNNGVIETSAENNESWGIRFNCSHGGVADFNFIQNTGQIVVIGDKASGIAFRGHTGGRASNNEVINFGDIVVSGNEATGIFFSGNYGGNANNNMITNIGSIVVSGSDAMGINLRGVDGSADSNVINNFGTIDAGPNGLAIFIDQGTNNVINLGGHSNVTGLIAATGSNNILNVAFTGVSPEARQALIIELAPVLTGSDSSGSFTVRGVTYTYDPLILVLNLSSYQEQAQTPNQAAIGANLDSFSVNPTGDMLDLLNALDQSGNVARGLEQLSPQRYQIYSDIALANANFVTQGIDQRLNNLRTGSESFDTSGLGVSSSSIQSKLGMSDGKSAPAAATMSKNGKGVTLKETVSECKRWGAFLSGEFTLADLDGRNWQQDSEFTSSGLLGGLDVKLTDSLTTGLLLSYAHTDADMDSQNSTADVDTYGAGVYAGYHEGNYYGNGLFSYSRNNYESERTINIPGTSRTADGSTDGNQYIVNLDGGYDHPVTENLSVGPFAGLQYVNLGVDSFTETGAGAANLGLDDQSVDSLRSRLGVRLELRKAVTCNWTAASEVRLAWQHEFLNNDRAIVSRFAGSGLGAFSVRTNEPERDAVLIGLGLNATYRETLTTFVDYDVQAGQSHYTEQIVKGGFKWSF